MKPIESSRIAVLGLGLMGGSFAAAIRDRCETVIGMDRRPEAVQFALDHNLIDAGVSEIEEAVSDIDITILAAPVRAILDQISTYARSWPAGSLLLDLGSTKQEVVRRMEILPESVHALGGHPMCGKELSGIHHADPQIFNDATFILTPLDRTVPEALAMAEALVRAVGSVPLILDPSRQDHLTATLSHLPYLLSCGLVATADAVTSGDPAAWEIVAGGFRDTSRISGSDIDMMIDILLTNRQEICSAVAAFQGRLGQLTQWVAEEDESALRESLTKIREERRRMFP